MFLTSLIWEEMGWHEGMGRVIFRLHEPLVYQRKDGSLVTAPADFWTDGCSVPRFPPVLFGIIGAKLNRNGVMHDYAYRRNSTPLFTFDEANDFLLETMGCAWPDEIDWAEKEMFYRGVQVGGHSSFHKYLVEDHLI